MLVLGLMSGTSLDGISAALVRFGERDNSVTADLLGFEVVAYTEGQRARLSRGLVGGSPEDYCRLNFDLGEWLGDAALRVLHASGVSRDMVAIASHGQTIWHVPGHSTWQLGEAAVIAERTGCQVVSDFRVGDMAAGGQGAPLVSMADRLLFSAGAHWRALQNIGGIGNVTLVPPSGAELGLRAFDTGPGVVVMNAVTRLVDPALAYDEDGRLARRGQTIHEAVAAMLDDPFFLAPPPKTTGREYFNEAYIRRFVDTCRAARPGATGPDLVASAVSLTARSIALGYQHFIPEPVADLVVSGGGAKHPVLLEALAEAVAPLRVVRFDDLFFDGEAKEAVAFALLGYLHLMDRPGNVPAATGARGGRVLGTRTPRPPVRATSSAR